MNFSEPPSLEGDCLSNEQTGCHLVDVYGVSQVGLKAGLGINDFPSPF